MRVVATFLLGLALSVGKGSAPAHAGELIRINGSGAALDVLTLMNDAYRKLHPETRIEMTKPLGSSGAIKALLAGALDLAVSSKPLTPEQVSQGALGREFGRTPLVIVTERNVPRSDITTRELEEIYAGTVKKWSNGEQIRIVLRPASDIDTTILRGLSPALSLAIDKAQAQPGMAVAVTDPESNDLVARTPGGIGASALCSLLVTKPQLNALALNGVVPGVGALADRTYPLAKDIRFITKGPPAPSVADFLEFIYSAAGRAIAEKAGVLVALKIPAKKTP
jgi:phosphate transport system substrate-binding protein